MIRDLLNRPPRSILLVRLSARGDLVFSSPLIRAFRNRYPQARIAWVAESHTKDIIENHPELDDLIVLDRVGWVRLLRQGRLLALFRAIRGFLRDLRRRDFDVAIDLQGLLRSGVVTALSGAPVRLGLGSREGSHLLMTRVIPRTGGDRRKISSEYRYLAQELGLDVGEFKLEVALAPSDRKWAEKKEEELKLDEGFMVALPFTTRPQKHWMEERWGQLLDRVEEELGLPPVILGAKEDIPALDRLRAGARREPLSLVGSTSLTQAGALIQRASLVIGVDTGLTHMGMAFDRPTVALFGSTIPYSHPPSQQGRVVVHRLDCSPCRMNPTCQGDFTCLKLITVEEAMAAAREVMTGEAGA